MNSAHHTIALLLMLALIFTPSISRAQSEFARLSQLNNDEKVLLERGRIVVHKGARVIGSTRLVGGTSWQRVNAPPDAVWRAVLDTPRYPNLLPEVSEARLVEDEAEKRLVFLRHGHGIISARYHLVVSYADDAKALWFHVAPNRRGSLRQGRGYIVVRPYDEDQSVIAFHVLADMSGGMIANLLRPRVQAGILRAPWVMKRFIEGRGRSRYMN